MPISGAIRSTLFKGVGGWTPARLGAALYDMWDAELTATISLSGSAVTAWASAKNGYSAAQAVGASRPIYSATSFNGRPGITFDGADDQLTYAGIGVFPVGSSDSEVWLLGDLTAAGATAGDMGAISYGGNGAQVSRAIYRTPVGGNNRARIRTGNAGANVIQDLASDFSGRHIVRAKFLSAGTSGEMDGVAGAAGLGPTATASTRTRLGSNSNDTASQYWTGKISLAAITVPLSTDQAALMLAYLKTRGGIA